jgi:hypothetical protein
MAHNSNLFFHRVTGNLKIEKSQTPTYNGHRKTGRVMKQKKAASIGTPIRHCCDTIGCTATFARPYDLIRHKSTVHGPKLQCPHPQCSYATARNDKMKDHEKRKHQKPSK